MVNEYVNNAHFQKKNYTKKPLPQGEYEDCVFTECNFEDTDLFEITFVECSFQYCDFSNAKFHKTALKEVIFSNCKILGVDFSVCNPFLLDIAFSDCQLNLASFYKLKLKGTKFINCTMQETDLVEANLSNAVFNNSDLRGATFEKTLLEKADFRTAYNYIFDPDLNQIKGAKFSKEEVVGLLSKYAISIT